MARQTVGSKYSEAARLLWQWAVKHGWSQADLAKKLACHTAMVARWLWGERRPSRTWAAKIQRTAKIKAPLWDTAATEITLPVKVAA